MRSKSLHTLSGLFVATLAIVFASGCAPFATYPPDSKVGLDNPAHEPVPTIMADAIRYVHLHHGGDHPVAINLPAGTSTRTYDKVIKRLGTGKPQTDANEWSYFIEQIRSRGLNAEADVFFPREVGPPAMITVYLRKQFDDYRVSHTKVWNLPIEMPAPNWQPDLDSTFQEESERVAAGE